MFYVGISVQKQYSLLDTIFKYMFYFGPPGKYLYLSPQIPLSLLRRPTGSGFGGLKYRYDSGGPK